MNGLTVANLGDALAIKTSRYEVILHAHHVNLGDARAMENLPTTKATRPNANHVEEISLRKWNYQMID
jgi:hypothetical protein